MLQAARAAGAPPTSSAATELDAISRRKRRLSVRGTLPLEPARHRACTDRPFRRLERCSDYYFTTANMRQTIPNWREPAKTLTLWPKRNTEAGSEPPLPAREGAWASASLMIQARERVRNGLGRVHCRLRMSVEAISCGSRGCAGSLGLIVPIDAAEHLPFWRRAPYRTFGEWSAEQVRARPEPYRVVSPAPGGSSRSASTWRGCPRVQILPPRGRA